MVQFLRKQGCTVRFSSADTRSEVPDNPSLIRASEVIILAVPIAKMEAVLEECFPLLDQKVLIEICSVKTFLIRKFEQLQAAYPEVRPHFFSIHPMFSEKLNDLRGQVVIETHRSATETGTFTAFRQLFEQHGAFWLSLPYPTHDRIMGVVQGLNHFNVFVGARTLQRAGFSLPEIQSFASPTYRIFIVIFTRYVLQNPRLYAEIQLYNHHVLEILKIFRDETERLYHLIEQRDEAGFVAYVEAIQPFFAENSADTLISDHLIEELGQALSPPE